MIDGISGQLEEAWIPSGQSCFLFLLATISINSIINRWLNLGINGWRLDATDLLSDEYLTHIYKSIKENNPDAVIIGELWQDATTFISEKDKKIRTYMCGNEIESVTDYPFHGLTINYALGNLTPKSFCKNLY